jgi:hypothetical protein
MIEEARDHSARGLARLLEIFDRLHARCNVRGDSRGRRSRLSALADSDRTEANVDSSIAPTRRQHECSRLPSYKRQTLVLLGLQRKDTTRQRQHAASQHLQFSLLA